MADFARSAHPGIQAQLDRLSKLSPAGDRLGLERTAADACILEVGLGGRLDSTNVIEQPLVTGITSLAVDHQQFLGSGLVGIAAEKAGIAKAGVPLVTQLYPRAVGRRIASITNDAGAVWIPRGGSWDAVIRQGRLRYRDQKSELDLPLPRLRGRHQAMNAALAVAMLRHQEQLRVPPSALTAAMGWADWPARLQHLAPGPLVGEREVWLDGGHNPSAARQIAAFAKRQFADGKPLHLVFASLATKDPA